MVVILVNTRRRIIGHHLVATGTLDTILVHPREIFRAAVIIGRAAALILAHNHPSGDSTPSEADIKVTRDLIRAGQLIKIEVLDHVIVLSKRLDKRIYAECWIMPSRRQSSVRFGVKLRGHLDWHLA